MRLKITFGFEGKLILPASYQLALQSMIYSLIDDGEIREFLHEIGFPYEKRVYKPFTFSWLEGRWEREDEKIGFFSPVRLYISSLWEPLIQSLSNAFLLKPFVELHHQQIQVESVEMLPEPEFKDKMIVKTLSPITVYSTLVLPSGRKYTHYYGVRDPEFGDLLRKNLIKKAIAFYGADLSDRPFSFVPYGSMHSHQKKTLVYKNTIIKAWHGTFLMEGDPRLQKIAYLVGVGSKNGQGFGMIEKLYL